MSMFRRIAGGAVVVVGSWAALSAQQAVAPATPPVLETVDQYQGAAAEQFLAKAKVKTVKDIGIGCLLYTSPSPRD